MKKNKPNYALWKEYKSKISKAGFRDIEDRNRINNIGDEVPSHNITSSSRQETDNFYRLLEELVENQETEIFSTPAYFVRLQQIRDSLNTTGASNEEIRVADLVICCFLDCYPYPKIRNVLSCEFGITDKEGFSYIASVAKLLKKNFGYCLKTEYIKFYGLTNEGDAEQIRRQAPVNVSVCNCCKKPYSIHFEKATEDFCSKCFVERNLKKKSNSLVYFPIYSSNNEEV